MYIYVVNKNVLKVYIDPNITQDLQDIYLLLVKNIRLLEYELGHVLGLEHDNNFEHRSVMATGGVSNRLSESDFEKVDILYGDNPYSYYNPFYKPSEEVRNGLYY